MNLVGDPPSYEDSRKLVEESWLTADIVERAFIRRVDDATARALLGRNGRGGEYQGLAFPYILPSQDRVREWRIRRDRPDVEYQNGKPKERAKYLAPSGRGNMLYFVPGAMPEALSDTSLPVLITEGEKKTLALHRLSTWHADQPRWFVVGLCGVWNWRGTVGKGSGPDGERRDIKGVIADFDRLVWDERIVYIVFDSDVHSNRTVAAARRQLADELRSRGARVQLVTLPEREGRKLGVDDMLAADGPEAVLALFDDATESGEPDLTRQPFTDAGNAERLVLMHGRNIRYCAELKSWLIWDGRRWVRDTTGEACRLVIDSMRAMYSQAASITDATEREAAEKHARRSEQARAIRDMLTLAPSTQGMTVSVVDFDRQPFLLNCTNGTLNLETGELYPHRRSDRLMKLCPHAYDAAAMCPEFLRFLGSAMGDRTGASDMQVEAAHVRVQFLQKAVGMSLTADVSEKVVFCLFGKTDGGKSTFLNAVRSVLGDDYSSQILIDSLLANARQSDNNSKADLVDLLGKRFVTTSEAEASQRLAEGRLKYLTQGAHSRIKAARKYENQIEFPASHKLWMDTNERPQVRTTNSSVWDRLKPVPFAFPVTADELDGKLPMKLQAEAAGILAWGVQGCMRWLSEGLGEIPDVALARQDWRMECDPLTEFIADECNLRLDDGKAYTFAAELWERYERWGRENGEKNLLTRKRLSERLKALGCRTDRRYDETGKQYRTWEGIVLL